MTVMGNLVSDPEPKRTAGGRTVVNFRVAQTSATERNGAWEDGETIFIRCVAYGPLADHMTASGIRKGSRVIVTGRFTQRDWQTETGERRSVLELTADDIGISIRHATVRISTDDESADPRPRPSRCVPGVHGSPNHRNRASEPDPVRRKKEDGSNRMNEAKG